MLAAASPDTDLIAPIRDRMAALITRHLGPLNGAPTPVPGLTIHGRSTPTAPDSSLYEPSFAFIVRGSKRVVLGSETFVYDESHFLLTAVGLPTIVEVLGASVASPYLSLKLDIDLELTRDLIAEVDGQGHMPRIAGPGIAVAPVTPALALASLRLLDLLDAPEDIPILAPQAQRDILYQVLKGPAGARLRQAALLQGAAGRVAAAIACIRQNYDRLLPIAELASVAGMGVSTLHHRFRELTGMSPLQYQKLLRIHEARHLLLRDGLDVGSAAHRVGYESVTQFTREYRRLLGAPPRRDVRAILSPPTP